MAKVTAWIKKSFGNIFHKKIRLLARNRGVQWALGMNEFCMGTVMLLTFIKRPSLEGKVMELMP